GHVALDFTVPSYVKLVRVRFSGYVQTHMYKGEVGLSGQNTSTVTLFKDIQTLLGTNGIASEPVLLPTGVLALPFSFRLPATQLPASFEGTHGRVRYEIAAVVVRPGHLNKIVSANLTVPSTMSPEDPELEGPVEDLKEREVGRWVWRSGYFSAKAEIQKCGFASEDVIPIKIDITNQSGSGVVLKDIYLKQKVTYSTFNEIRGPQTERVHRLTFSESYPPTTRQISRTIHFPIPTTAIMSPTIRTSILEVSHVLCVKIASTARFSPPIKLELPIVVAGFPAPYFDPGSGRGRASIDTLPLY
ncbi:hypothetical protein BDK51DRAFT_15298, partial [Blyttiomyces helicus]